MRIRGQKQAILEHLKKGGSLTPIDALRLTGTMKLATRVSELRDMGHPIKDEWVEKDGAKFKRYWI